MDAEGANPIPPENYLKLLNMKDGVGLLVISKP
jgi:hypothetical protein